jgi:hypothetical protein
MPTPHPTARFREVEVERILIREPNQGRVRAVLETCPPRPAATGAPVPAVRLSLLGPDGKSQITLEVDDAGEPTVYVGPTGAGTTVVVTRASLDAWHLGNVIAALGSTDDGGRLELRDADGKTVLELPASPGG